MLYLVLKCYIFKEIKETSNMFYRRRRYHEGNISRDVINIHPHNVGELKHTSKSICYIYIPFNLRALNKQHGHVFNAYD